MSQSSEKEYKVTEVQFDLDGGEKSPCSVHWMVRQVCGKPWFAFDEDDLCNQITKESGWCVLSFSCEKVEGAGAHGELVEGDGESDGELVEVVKEMKDITLCVPEASSPEFRAKMLAELKLLGDRDLRVVVEISKELLSTIKETKCAERREKVETRKKGRELNQLVKFAQPKPVYADYDGDKKAYQRERYWWDKFHNPNSRYYVGFKEEEAGAKE
jgi:hypothetical protein